MFRNREDAARILARRLEHRPFRDPLVLAIPRGGVVTGAVLAQALNADLDVVLSRKLRAPYQPEAAIGAVGEDGHVHMNQAAIRALEIDNEYLAQECAYQLREISRRRSLFRAVRPRAKIEGRSVIVTDDGIATGATMIAALDAVRGDRPFELIVAVPVGSHERIQEVREHCDEVVALIDIESFWAVGQFYTDFREVTDNEAVELLRDAYQGKLRTTKPGEEDRRTLEPAATLRRD